MKAKQFSALNVYWKANIAIIFIGHYRKREPTHYLLVKRSILQQEKKVFEQKMYTNEKSTKEKPVKCVDSNTELTNNR